LKLLEEDKENEYMNSWEIIKKLKKDGWCQVGITGSHHHFKHPNKKGKVTVPHPKKDIPIKTLISIEKQAGIKLC
jgi:predicted RNA binding protein YcfA (HicA-like mRNA interferase family)